MKYFAAEQVRDFFNPPLVKTELINTLKTHFADLHRGEAVNSPRLVLELGQKAAAALGAMLATSSTGAMLATNQTLIGGKIVCVVPQNTERGLNPHQGVVILFSPIDGTPLGIFDATEITAYRTAAMSAAATAILSREDSETLTIVGTGYQAFLHAIFTSQIRQLKEIRIFARNPENSKSLQKKLAEELTTKVTVATDLGTSVANSDILCLCTSARTPYFSSQQLPPGIHVNAIGACRPGMREIEVVPRSELRVFVDDPERCREEAQELDLLFAGDRSLHPLTAIGAVFSENCVGRSNRQQITLFKSVGVGLQDIATAAMLLA